jgi:SAM-dependent methyltransferase
MDGVWGNLKLFTDESLLPAAAPVFSPLPAASTRTRPAPVADPWVLANQELIRPNGSRRAAPGLVPFSAAWYDELEHKRYQRHGVWLPAALEFGRHPGESLLLLGPGIGSDAIRYLQTGTLVTVGITGADQPDRIRENLTRHALPVRLVDVTGPIFPFPDGTFDVVVWNALYDTTRPDPARVAELFRVLKAGGKLIGLFPARYDAGYWQDLILPLQWLYWRRPADPATGTKTTARQLRRVFADFTGHKVAKRHLRRAELPHPWRLFPLMLLERLIGRVLVFKAFKPLTARSGTHSALAA